MSSFAGIGGLVGLSRASANVIGTHVEICQGKRDLMKRYRHLADLGMRLAAPEPLIKISASCGIPVANM